MMGLVSGWPRFTDARTNLSGELSFIGMESFMEKVSELEEYVCACVCHYEYELAHWLSQYFPCY